MPKGGMGRKRDMGDIRAFLNWAVLEKKYLAMEWPITFLANPSNSHNGNHSA